MQGSSSRATAGPACSRAFPSLGASGQEGYGRWPGYVAALREVAAAPMPEAELVGRPRLVQNPGERDMPRLFVGRAAWLAAPAWHARQTAAEVASARAVAVATLTAFVNGADPVDPTALVLHLWLERPRVDGDPAERCWRRRACPPRRTGWRSWPPARPPGTAPAPARVVEADICAPARPRVTDRRH